MSVSTKTEESTRTEEIWVIEGQNTLNLKPKKKKPHSKPRKNKRIYQKTNIINK